MNSKFLKKETTAVTPRSYFYIIVGLMIVFFVLSSYMHIQRSHRLERKILYYQSASYEGGSEPVFIPEIRNIPSEKYYYIHRMDYYTQSNVQRFMDELMLGSQNLYAKDILPSSVRYKKTIENRKRKLIFIMLYTDSGINDSFINSDDILILKEWISLNVKKYYPEIQNVVILLNKKKLGNTLTNI